MNVVVRKQILAVLTLLVGGPVALWPQTRQDVPTIEPTYTRIFGSDTLDIGSPVMSPDGRWIAFAVFENMNRQNLWIVSSGGGEPIRLTDGDHSDAAPLWFPNSGRIAFRSESRRPYWAIMTVSIDPQTGQPTEPPRPVTLEGSSAWFDVSPDGKWIAYTPEEQGQRIIRIVPSTGGAARTLIRANTPIPVWGPEGRYIYYALDGVGEERIFMRISAQGGEPDTVFTWPKTILYWRNANRRLLLLTVSRDPPVYEVATLQGESLTRLELPQTMSRPVQLTTDNQLLAVISDIATPLRVLPIDGGPARQLTDGSAHRYPLEWIRDGRVFFETELNGDDISLLAPPDGGAMHQVRLPEPRMADFYPVLSEDGEQLLYAVSQDDPKLSTLKVLSVGDGRSSILSRVHAHNALGSLLGRGGTHNRDGANFLYVESKQNVRELRASPAEGPSRLLWSFPAEQAPTAVSVHGDRIAIVRNRPATTLHLATASDHEAHEILRVPGALDEVVWSPDGKWIAATHWDTLAADRAGDNAWIMFVQVSPEGQLVGEPRFAGDKMVSWWNLRWLPDSRGILATGMDANVWLLPVDPDADPVCLTRDDPNVSWNYVVSPDGRHIVYHVQVPRGSSIWMVDLGEISEPTRN